MCCPGESLKAFEPLGSVSPSRDVDNLADELQLLNLQSTVWTIGACRLTTTGVSNSQSCSGTALVESPQCSAWFC